ncbi:hypothetical protein BJ322DRAFT_1020477 [Thelephora terrestris]|uniref:Uncharacterized protein n=1 Tax=Thelephora terrestris TaxID=56493 RepID=A0A9P6HHS0_9AGAM|nr:hypothetical protein BJ322DRAFT_1020477 [Thelephora terrestris]
MQVVLWHRSGGVRLVRLSHSLPGSESRIDKLITVALTVGSPTLAAFSLAITALNTRWANDRFPAIEYPNRLNAAKALIYLQRVPLRLITSHALLALAYIWTIAAATSMVWMIITFAFAIVDSLMNLGSNVNSNGQGVGTLWLWPIPVIVGWLWIPVFSHEKLKAAIDKANEIAYVATTENNPQIDDSQKSNARHMSPTGKGLGCTRRRFPPRTPRGLFQSSTSEDLGVDWVPRASPGLLRMPCPEARASVVWEGIFVAVFALGLQWSTTGSAAVTPTTGLGCRSGSYILYGIVSTMRWLILLLSSCLVHFAKPHHGRGYPSRSRLNSANLAENLATFLRRLSTFAAVGNTLCIILACVFQFSDFYSACYCNSSVLGRGAQYAFNIITPGYDYDGTRAAWIGGIMLAGGCVMLFMLALHLILELSNDITNDCRLLIHNIRSRIVIDHLLTCFGPPGVAVVSMQRNAEPLTHLIDDYAPLWMGVL